MRSRIVKIPLLLVVACALVWAGDVEGVWLDVPFVKQAKNGCGAASIAMVMQFWQRQQGISPNADSDADQIQTSLYSSRAHGIYASDLKSYFDEHGYQAFAFKGRAQDLSEHLANGRPLIVALQPGARAPLHYVVVVGFDPVQKILRLNDPAERKLLQRELSAFEKEWKGTGNWTLLAVPRTQSASSSR